MAAVSALSHLDDDGRPRMVDVSGKPVTEREAVASGRLETTAEVVALVRADGLPKADVLATARIAGIQGAKRTSELVPLCHPLPLSGVTVDFGFTASAITVTATARTTGRTGVEMEALTAVAVAGLTLHDMVKAVDPAAELTAVRLERKTGGKTGPWRREDAGRAPDTGNAVGTAHAVGTARAVGTGHSIDTAHTPDTARSVDAGHCARTGQAATTQHAGTAQTSIAQTSTAQTSTAIVIVSSTGVAAGTREDGTGAGIAAWLAEHGHRAVTRVVADADIAAALARAAAEHPAVIVTTGGTGVSPTDRTPEATRAVLARELPGVAEAIRARGVAQLPAAALSRALAGVTAHGTLVVNLPGSPGGVTDGLAVLEPILDHLLAQIAGGGPHA
ncbi:MAG: bifunctional molybdenum cofactor biosynthesis protein MoaC/MoaB [Microbacteriaceae bacterium]